MPPKPPGGPGPVVGRPMAAHTRAALERGSAPPVFRSTGSVQPKQKNGGTAPAPPPVHWPRPPAGPSPPAVQRAAAKASTLTAGATAFNPTPVPTTPAGVAAVSDRLVLGQPRPYGAGTYSQNYAYNLYLGSTLVGVLHIHYDTNDPSDIGRSAGWDKVGLAKIKKSDLDRAGESYVNSTGLLARARAMHGGAAAAATAPPAAAAAASATATTATTAAAAAAAAAASAASVVSSSTAAVTSTPAASASLASSNSTSVGVVVSSPAGAPPGTS